MMNAANARRAYRALETIAAYGKYSDADSIGDDIVVEAMGDLLADLHHLADTLDRTDLLPACYDNSTTWEAMISRADMHYTAEVNEED